MITRKQYPNHHVFETSIGGRPFTVETGKVAELADAECICRYGDTVVLTTVTCSPDPKPGIDYFPLTIEFEERMYAVGRIPGSFNRREGKPSERGILNSRIIDRPMRPLFDDELRNDVVVTCTVLANDCENPVEIVASLGASISVACSDVPWNGPIATTNVAYVGGQYVINPSAEQRSAAECFVCIASTFEKVVMIETEAKEAPESIVLECIRIAHETNMEVVKFINTIVETIGKPKFTFEKAAVNHDLLDDLCAYGMNQIEYALDTDDKNVREERLTAARRDFADKFAEKYEDFDVNIEVCLYKMQKKVVKKWLLEGKRVDGRQMDEIRPLDAEVGVLPRVHGSGLFSRGQTQVLSICTLNTLSAAQKLDTIYPEESKRYIHHYNFPAFSTGEARASRSTSRREIGHGCLAEKALLPVIPRGGRVPLCHPCGLRGRLLQRLHVPGLHLRLDAGPDGRRCAHQAAGGRYLLRPDLRPGDGRVENVYGHPGRGRLPRRDGLQGRRYDGGRHGHPDGPEERWPDDGDHCRCAGALPQGTAGDPA